MKNEKDVLPPQSQSVYPEQMVMTILILLLGLHSCLLLLLYTTIFSHAGHGKFEIDNFPMLDHLDELRNTYLKRSTKEIYQPWSCRNYYRHKLHNELEFAVLIQTSNNVLLRLANDNGTKLKFNNHTWNEKGMNYPRHHKVYKMNPSAFH